MITTHTHVKLRGRSLTGLQTRDSGGQGVLTIGALNGEVEINVDGDGIDQLIGNLHELREMMDIQASQLTVHADWPAPDYS